MSMVNAELAKGIYQVGAVDWTNRDFHGYKTPRGVTYNSYLLVDEKICLIDTVKAPFAKELLERVQNGAFAREWILENQAGRPRMKAWMTRERQHPIEQVGAELRRMMPWMEPKGAPDV